MTELRVARVRQGMTALGSAGVAAVVVAAYSIGSGGGSSAKADTTTPTTNVVTVDGAGQVAGVPDTMIATISVNTRGASPAVALGGASKTMSVVQHALTSRGVAAKDLKTTGLQVNPYYVYGKGKQTLHGYSAEQDLQVTLHNLATAGKTITAATAAGGKSVTVGGLTLDLQGNSALVTNARADAYNDAKAKAQQYAGLAGRTLGSVVSVSEHVNQPTPYPQYGFAAASAAAAMPGIPIQAGQQNVNVNVTVVWNLN
ncbi:MAG: uncharacterized protein QOI76_607 [Frankiales bacterium]|nr:uncharacterized protein [Frankiales bacterium]